MKYIYFWIEKHLQTFVIKNIIIQTNDISAIFISKYRVSTILEKIL